MGDWRHNDVTSLDVHADAEAGQGDGETAGE